MVQVVATVTSKWDHKSYRGIPISKIENYSIDSALDTDADQFSFTLGGLEPELLIPLFDRDSEIRVAIAASIRGNTLVPLLRGFVDTVGLTQDGECAFTGRDWSAVAVDDTAEPQSFVGIRPSTVIRQQAIARGYPDPIKTIATMSNIQGLYTDGSESVWAFWYRMARQKNMWVWTDQTGQLNVRGLNYGAPLSYYFGVPTKKYPNAQWMNVIDASIQKTTKDRIAQVWVFGDTGLTSFAPVKEVDPRITDWIKRPLNIVTGEAAITTIKDAQNEANTEIVDGMVGAIEIVISITDPGWIVQQNTTCFLNLPDMGITGEYFVVGVVLVGDPDGYVQQIRLRQRHYALVIDKPTQPVFDTTGNDFTPSALGNSLGVPYSDYFVQAAQKYYHPWPYDLFLAALIGISQWETGIRNVREEYGNPGNPDYGGVEWSIPPTAQGNTVGNIFSATQYFSRDGATDVLTLQVGNAVTKWKENFANAAGDPLNPFGREAGVGPMQLTDLGLKQEADALFGPTSNDEFLGGRWVPQWNIMVAAKFFAETCLKGLTPTEANLWLGIARYNEPSTTTYHTTYLRHVQPLVLAQLKSIDNSLKTTPYQPAGSSNDQYLPNGTPQKVGEIIVYGKRQVGVAPYKWTCSGPYSGCVTPAGVFMFDCSGLVYYCYAQAGLGEQIGGRESTYGYWNAGVAHGNLFPVAVSDLKAADMVFFGPSKYDPSNVPHMGLYYYNNQMIVAPQTGQDVQIQNIFSLGTLVPLGGMRLQGLWPVANIFASSLSAPPSVYGPPDPKLTAQFTAYSQCDSQWGSHDIYDGSVTLCSNGSGPTSAAMVISNLGSKSVSPDTVATFMTAFNGYTANQATATGIISALQNWGLSAQTLGNNNAAFVQAAKTISDSGMVIALGGTFTTPYTSAGRVIVLHALSDSGGFIAENPATTVDPAKAGYSIATLQPLTSQLIAVTG